MVCIELFVVSRKVHTNRLAISQMSLLTPKSLHEGPQVWFVSRPLARNPEPIRPRNPTQTLGFLLSRPWPCEDAIFCTSTPEANAQGSKLRLGLTRVCFFGVLHLDVRRFGFWGQRNSLVARMFGFGACGRLRP